MRALSQIRVSASFSAWCAAYHVIFADYMQIVWYLSAATALSHQRRLHPFAMIETLGCFWQSVYDRSEALAWVEKCEMQWVMPPLDHGPIWNWTQRSV